MKEFLKRSEIVEKGGIFKMKRMLLIAALLMVVGLPKAHAIPVELDIVDLYDWGRLYDYSGGVGGTYTPLNSNPFGGSAGTAITADTFGNSDGMEDTWGIAQVEQIQSIPSGTTFFDKDINPYELTVLFTGFDDDFMSTPSVLGSTEIGSVGGSVQIYKDVTPDYDPSLGTSGRTGATSYTGVTDGLLVLDLVPVVQPSGHTFLSTFNFTALTGSGSLFLSTTGLGAWDSMYDTNTQLFGSDISMSSTSKGNSIPTVADWAVRGDGRAEGAVVPEPASMILFGAGLLGFIARRKKRIA